VNIKKNTASFAQAENLIHNEPTVAVTINHFPNDSKRNSTLTTLTN